MLEKTILLGGIVTTTVMVVYEYLPAADFAYFWLCILWLRSLTHPERGES